MNWRPVSELPEPFESVAVFCASGQWLQGYYDDLSEQWLDVGGFEMNEPTHWCEILPPPATSPTKAEQALKVAADAIERCRELGYGLVADGTVYGNSIMFDSLGVVPTHLTELPTDEELDAMGAEVEPLSPEYVQDIVKRVSKADSTDAGIVSGLERLLDGGPVHLSRGIGGWWVRPEDKGWDVGYPSLALAIAAAVEGERKTSQPIPQGKAHHKGDCSAGWHFR